MAFVLFRNISPASAALSCELGRRVRVPKLARLGVRLALDDKRLNELLRARSDYGQALCVIRPCVRLRTIGWLLTWQSFGGSARSCATRGLRGLPVPTTSKGQRSRLKPGFGDVCSRLGESKWKAANSMSPIFAVPSTADYWWSTSASRVGSTPSR